MKKLKLKNLVRREFLTEDQQELDMYVWNTGRKLETIDNWTSIHAWLDENVGPKFKEGKNEDAKWSWGWERNLDEDGYFQSSACFYFTDYVDMIHFKLRWA
jgi:hypothetical protein